MQRPSSSPVPAARVPIDSRLGRTVSKIAGSRTFARFAPRFVAPLDRAVHRLTRGRHTVSEWLVPTAVVTTIGAKSGEPRTVPLACLPDGDSLYVVGSNFGREHHPAWTVNLLAHPDAEVAAGGTTRAMRATLLDTAATDAVWPRLIAIWPNYDAYRDRSGRTLRVFRFDPIGDDR